jgi:hypothetical protein
MAPSHHGASGPSTAALGNSNPLASNTTSLASSTNPAISSVAPPVSNIAPLESRLAPVSCRSHSAPYHRMGRQTKIFAERQNVIQYILTTAIVTCLHETVGSSRTCDQEMMFANKYYWNAVIRRCPVPRWCWNLQRYAEQSNYYRRFWFSCWYQQGSAGRRWCESDSGEEAKLASDSDFRLPTRGVVDTNFTSPHFPGEEIEANIVQKSRAENVISR